MNPSIRNISFNIFAESDEEAERGCAAIKQFIRIMGEHGAMVSGNKIADAVARLDGSSFVKTQIINFFKQ
jgi:ribulose-5-phosphate 4-epimerase/fuculose-1-phosphate aldolase